MKITEKIKSQESLCKVKYRFQNSKLKWFYQETQRQKLQNLCEDRKLLDQSLRNLHSSSSSIVTVLQRQKWLQQVRNKKTPEYSNYQLTQSLAFLCQKLAKTLHALASKVKLNQVHSLTIVLTCGKKLSFQNVKCSHTLKFSLKNKKGNTNM